MEQKERDPRIISEFKKRKKRQIVVMVLVMPVILSLWIAGGILVVYYGTIAFLLCQLPAFVLFAILGIYSLLNWQCPACSEFLGRGSPRFCRNCGVRLE